MSVLRGKLDIITDSTNAPVVGIPVDNAFLVKRWDGSSWAELQPNCSAGRLARSSQGSVVVACVTSSNQLVAKRWTGSIWETFGSALNLGRSQPLAAFAIAPTGEPIIVVYNYNGYTLTVHRLTAAGWEQVGSNLRDTANSNFFEFYVSASVDRLGRIYVSYKEQLVGLMKRWDGTAWVQLGQSLNVTTDFTPGLSSIVFDDSSNPITVFGEGNEGAIVLRWKQNSWEKLASGRLNSKDSSPDVFSVSQTVDGTIVIAAFSPNPSVVIRSFKPTQ